MFSGEHEPRGANRYCPDGWTTRGQMASFLIRGLFTP
jgi:hypothetical protein